MIIACCSSCLEVRGGDGFGGLVGGRGGGEEGGRGLDE